MLTQKILIILIILQKVKVSDYCVYIYVTKPPNPKIAYIKYSRPFSPTPTPISKIKLEIKTKAKRYIIMKDSAMYLDKNWFWVDQDSKGQEVDLNFTKKLEIDDEWDNVCGKSIEECSYKRFSKIVFMVYVYLKDETFNVCTLNMEAIEKLIKKNNPNREFLNDMDFVNEYIRNYEDSALHTLGKNEHKESSKKDKDFLEKMGAIMVNYCAEEATNFTSHLPEDNNTSDEKVNVHCSSWSEAYRRLGLLII